MFSTLEHELGFVEADEVRVRPVAALSQRSRLPQLPAVISSTGNDDLSQADATKWLEERSRRKCE